MLVITIHNVAAFELLLCFVLPREAYVINDVIRACKNCLEYETILV